MASRIYYPAYMTTTQGIDVMSGLIAMLLSTLGATGMGAGLKILGGIFQSISSAKETAAKRELVRDMAMHKADVEFQKAVFGDANADHGMFTRHTRRLIALIGMSNFAVISDTVKARSASFISLSNCGRAIYLARPRSDARDFLPPATSFNSWHSRI